MGTWDFGPFDNDGAADFADTLDRSPIGARPGLVRAALLAAPASGAELDADLGQEAVAAAALVAARCRGGEPVNPVWGPQEEIPGLGGELVGLAVRALDAVTGPGSELAELWAESGEGERWQEVVARLRGILVAEHL
ncbi:DUF4259 domain-containing protein [Kitasatospora sp. NPDC006697]|uniref:DUF4259 domain-containing protein n=1 Tax=Kitasatospora sp. NPDC006697 TaxID=3364020 RepID=UPI003693D037